MLSTLCMLKGKAIHSIIYLIDLFVCLSKTLDTLAMIMGKEKKRTRTEEGKGYWFPCKDWKNSDSKTIWWEVKTYWKDFKLNHEYGVLLLNIWMSECQGHRYGNTLEKVRLYFKKDHICVFAYFSPK